MPSPLHSSDYQLFRNMLIKARESAGMTQLQVAERLGKMQSFVSKYERGERRLDFTEFIEIVAVLKIDVHAFINAYQSSTTNLHKRR